MRIAIGVCLALAGCSRAESSASDAAAVASDAATASEAAPRALDAAAYALPAEEAPPPTFVGPRRARLAKLDDEPALVRNADAIRAHFGGSLPASMELQAVALAKGKQALLLSAIADDPKPIELLVDATGLALTTKDHPLGGITPPARPFVIAPRPDGGVALFVYDEPTKLVAARMSAVDGAPYAELILFELARCDAISAAWWPGRGWIVATSFPGGARAQLVREEGTPAWDPQGVSVGEGWRAPAPATIAIDPQTSTWVLLQHATRGGADHVVAFRYGPEGARLGKGAIDLGAVPRVASASDRVGASLARPGVIRVEVAGKAVELPLDSTR